MKVTDKTHTDAMEGTSKSGGAKKKDSAKTSSLNDLSSDSVGSAKVKLSERAQDMKKIKEAINSQPDVDEAKVAKYKSMLAKGEYKVDSKAVADKMVDEHAYNAFFDVEE